MLGWKEGDWGCKENGRIPSNSMGIIDSTTKGLSNYLLKDREVPTDFQKPNFKLGL